MLIFVLIQPPNLPTILKVSSVPPLPVWEPHQFLANALMLQNDVGDVQTALAVLIVMGDHRKFLPIEESLIVSMTMNFKNLSNRRLRTGSRLTKATFCHRSLNSICYEIGFDQVAIAMLSCSFL